MVDSAEDSGKHQTARDRMFPIVWAALSWASVVTWAYYDVCNGDIGVLHIRGEKPRRIAHTGSQGHVENLANRPCAGRIWPP